MKLHPWDRLTKGYKLICFHLFLRQAGCSEASQLPHMDASHLPLSLLVLANTWDRAVGLIHTKNSHFLTQRDCGGSCLITFCSHRPGGNTGDNKKMLSWEIRCHATVRGALWVPGCDAQLTEPLRISKVLWGSGFSHWHQCRWVPLYLHHHLCSSLEENGKEWVSHVSGREPGISIPKVKCVFIVTPVCTSPQHCPTAAAFNYGCGTTDSFWNKEEWGAALEFEHKTEQNAFFHSTLGFNSGQIPQQLQEPLLMWVQAVPNIWAPLGVRLVLAVQRCFCREQSQVCVGNSAVPQASAATHTHGIGQKTVRIKDRRYSRILWFCECLVFHRVF